jgi:hypothetical protein
MADHLDAPGLMSPRGNAKTDITDIYLFQKPGDPNKSILILDVNPLAPTLANSFEHNGLYQLKIDTDADALAEIVFRISFSPYSNGHQTATVRRATGNEAERNDNSGEIIINNALCSFTGNEHITTAGAYKFFAGLRSDPFFFDLVGFMHGLKFTSSDFFADKDVFSIVLEMPNKALGDNPKIGVWSTTYVNGTRDDRMGRPAINTVFNHGADKNTFNQINPAQDRARFLNSFVKTLESFGYGNAKATDIARILLPDILTYDYTSSEGFLNGRKLADDVIDISLALITNGKVTTDKVGPHHDYLAHFPYVGKPHHK